jgi:hypothetical protein
MRCPPVEILGLRKYSSAINFGQIHDLFGSLHGQVDKVVKERRKWIGFPILSSESRHVVKLVEDEMRVRDLQQVMTALYTPERVLRLNPRN